MRNLKSEKDFSAMAINRLRKLANGQRRTMVNVLVSEQTSTGMLLAVFRRKGGNIVDTIKVFLTTLFLSGIFLVYGECFAAAGPAGLTRTSSEGGVTVKTTLLSPEGAGETRFQVVLDTHSVNLDGYDLKALTLLRDDAGKTYEPSRIENKGSGHHREITVLFSGPTNAVKRLELVIKGIAGIKERTFLWELD